MRTPQDAIKWSERMIARALAVQVFNKKYLVVVPNCTWTGDEIDVLAVTPDLRIVDVEVKISRADFKADARKDKWYHRLEYNQWQAYRRGEVERRRREWPRRVWKHYYALPKALWNDELLAHVKACAPRSGVILMTAAADGRVHAHIERRCQPNRDAKPISAEDAVNLARLASLRMWDAYVELNKIKESR